MATARDNADKGPRYPSRLSNEEAQLWRRAVADVTPLRSAKPAKTTGPPTPPPPTSPSALPARASGAVALSPRRVVAQPLSPVEVAASTAPGIDKRTAVRLRRGLIRPETRLDLHHQSQAEAHRLLDCFLATSEAAGHRCVLVITGKGSRSGGAGVLRTMVPRWLNEPPNEARVLAFCSAIPAHGGDGALYLLLRRSRQSKSR